jgi:hydrogenase maturation factor
MMRLKRFQTGKIPFDVLRRIVFKYLGTPSRNVLLGPSIGEDAAVVRFKGNFLILKTDPITGAENEVGWLSVHINANDVVTRGAQPLWYMYTLLLPPSAKESTLKSIVKQIDAAAREIGVPVVGGHSEVTPGIHKPIVIGAMVGTVLNDYLTTSGAKAGDEVILTKGAGIEGTAILARDLERELLKVVDRKVLKRAKKFSKNISVVKDALTAIRAGGVNALHDPTEGGIINGLWELAEASKLGIMAYEDAIMIAPETKAICEALGIDPLRLMGSGALLIAAKPRKTHEILRRLKEEGIPASTIGRMKQPRKGRTLISTEGRFRKLKPPPRDEIYKVLERFR